MRSSSIPKRPTNLSLDRDLLREAKALRLNISQAAEAGLRQAVAEAKSSAWKRDNAEALASSNDWADKHGLPLEKYRRF